MAGRAPRRRVGLPTRLQQVAIGQSHQDRVQRAGTQPDLKSQLIAVAPRRGVGHERRENLDSLARRAARSSHAAKSTYVELDLNPCPWVRSWRAASRRRCWVPTESSSWVGIDSSSEHIMRYLSDTHGVKINARRTRPPANGSRSWSRSAGQRIRVRAPPAARRPHPFAESTTSPATAGTAGRARVVETSSSTRRGVGMASGRDASARPVPLSLVLSPAGRTTCASQATCRVPQGLPSRARLARARRIRGTRSETMSSPRPPGWAARTRATPSRTMTLSSASAIATAIVST